MNKLGTMKAVQLDAPGPPEALHLRDLPMPQPSAGWVRIRVEAFGLNRSELHLRLGLAEGVTFPRVPGIECAGVVDAAPGTSFRPGQQVVAMMGGMGRVFDGGYAQYAVAPASQVIPIRTDLPWEVVGALPEMLQTAYGSLIVGLDLQRGQSLLIRGGTSSVGLAAAALAREMGATVLATTRRRERLASLAERGIDHPILDGGEIAPPATCRRPCFSATSTRSPPEDSRCRFIRFTSWSRSRRRTPRWRRTKRWASSSSASVTPPEQCARPDRGPSAATEAEGQMSALRALLPLQRTPRSKAGRQRTTLRRAG